MDKNNQENITSAGRGHVKEKKNVTINIGQEEVINYHRSDSIDKKQEKKNLNEGLLSKINIFEQRAHKTPSILSFISRHNNSKADDKKPVERRISPEKKKSIFMINNPLEEEEDEEKEEKNQKKVEFNQVVEEMAQFYINEPEFSNFYFSQFLETVAIHMVYFLFGPLIVPFLFLIYSKNFIRNMGLWGKKLASSHRVQIFYWISFVITIVFTLFINNAEGDTKSIWNLQLVFLCPAYITQIMVLIRYITVCVKYGFFPREYYKKWKSARLTRTEVKSNFLLQGWIKPSLLVLDVYLKEIFQKFNIDVNYFKFKFAGKLPDKMKNSLLEVDKLINEDARRIRFSIFRRMKKENNLYDTIQKAIKKYKNNELTTKKTEKNLSEKSDDSSSDTESKNKPNEKVFEMVNIKHIERNDSLVSSSVQSSMVSESPLTINNINNDVANPNDEHVMYRASDASPNLTNRSAYKPLKGKQRLREFIIDKILRDVRERIQRNVSTIESKVKCKNEHSYEIKGIYFCRALLRDVCNKNLESYVIFHKIFVFLIWLTPFVFTYLYYIYFNNLIVNQLADEEYNILPKLNMTITNSTSVNNSILNSTSSFNKNNQQISFHYLSILLLVFSAISLVPPVWLNTLNLLYGVVDIKRKTKFMEILTEMINTNLKDDQRKYPLLNITDPNSVLNWYYLRNIFLSFGKRFGDRLILQTSIFCLFVVLALILSILTLFGWFNQFLALCLGVSFTFSVMINFIIVFHMFLLGADFNFYEFHHSDWMLTHKLFIDEIINNSKLIKSIKKNKGKNPDNVRTSSEGLRNRETVYSRTTTMTENTQNDIFQFMLSNNANSEVFVKIILSDEILAKSGDPVNYFVKTSRVLENLKEKIKVDSFVRPLKIFWVKSDYAMIGRIVALLGTGVAMISGNIMKGIDISKYLPNK